MKRVDSCRSTVAGFISRETRVRRQPATGNRQLQLALAVLLAIVVPIAANACPVCFGDPNSPMTKGTSNGVLFLLGIVGFVQLGFVALFFSFWRRAQALKKFREQFHVVKGGVI